jgi:hypothetical protein
VASSFTSLGSDTPDLCRGDGAIVRTIELTRPRRAESKVGGCHAKFLFSVDKSVTSASIGIALDEGYIDDVNDPLITYLPEMKGHGFDWMTIRDVLLMSGIRFSSGDEAGNISTKFPYTALNPYADESQSHEHPNMRKLALGLPASEEGTFASDGALGWSPKLISRAM